MRKTAIISLVALATLATASAQNPNAETLGQYKTPARRTINIPDVDGMKFIKCDFHIHTVNSDGNVHASVRVDEAWEEGLDAIAITEHISHNPGAKDENRSYNQAIEQANRKGITLIRGGEMTYSMAPGHANALFVTDVNKLQTANWRDAYAEAKAQGAFIEWNHPGWGVEKILWHPEHQELYEKGMINGIEIFCEMEYYPVAADWCYDKNLTMIANSDSHEAQVRLYDFQTTKHRPMTLVLARDNSPEAIKEAMFAGRTAAYYFGRLTTRKEIARPLVENSIELLPAHYQKDGQNYRRLVNKSDLNFTFSIKNPVKGAPHKIVLLGGTSTDVVVADGVKGVEYEVVNVIVGKGNERLTVTLF